MAGKKLSAKDRIILPLDFDSFKQAEEVIIKLRDQVGLFKVGLTLFIKEGPQVLRLIQERVGEDKIFFDLKFHDIPETVGSVSSVLRSLSYGIKFITVHTSEGERILKAAVDALQHRTQVLGITVLTSLTDSELGEVGIPMTVKERVLKLSAIAQRAGCAGVVCSGHEADDVKRGCGKDFIVVTPGIRPKWARVPGDDQRRIMTPGEAIQNGADYVVVGRPIYQSTDRVGAARRVSEEIEEALRRLSERS